MKNILLMFVLYSLNVMAGPVPMDWIMPTNNQKAKTQQDLKALENRFENIMNFQKSILNSDLEKEDKKWKVQSILTELAVEAEGELGILGAGGEAAVELVWIKKQDPTRGGRKALFQQEIEDEASDVIGIHTEMTTQEIVQQFAPVMQIAKKSGVVSNLADMEKELTKYALSFQEISKAIEVSDDFKWYVYKYQLELYINSKGKVSPVASVGTKFRIRLEWWRLRNQAGTKNISAKARNNASFISTIAKDLSLLDNVKTDNDFKINVAKIGIGVGLEGNIFIAKTKGHVIGSLFFMKDEKEMKSSNLTLNSNYELDGKVFKRESFQKGIKKAADIASVFTTLAGKEKQEDKFSLRVIELEFEIFTEGGIGLLTAKGIGSFVLFATRGVTI